MKLCKRVLAALALVQLAFAGQLNADVQVFEPFISLDQRIDDNYYLITGGDTSLTATRGVAGLNFSQESQSNVFSFLARVDALLTTDNEQGEEGSDFNYLLGVDYSGRTARSRFGFKANTKQDTPSRDIVADISEASSYAADPGFNATQTTANDNVERVEYVLKPSFEYDLSRRLSFTTDLTHTIVEHGLPAPQDVIYKRYLDTLARNPDGSFVEEPLPYDAVSIEDVGVFSPDGELSDSDETELEIGFRYKLTPISTVFTKLGYSQFVSEEEVANAGFEQLIPDPEVPEIRRRPRVETTSTTQTFKLGYERFLRENLELVAYGGVYDNSADDSTESDGYLADVELRFVTGNSRYVGRYSVDVQPSSVGSQVETNELTGQISRIMSADTTFEFKARAYEPDRLGARASDRYARRFISFEPKLVWQFSRNWTVTSAYRYRRQRARVDVASADSHALLFSLKYTPPSELRDAARARGL